MWRAVVWVPSTVAGRDWVRNGVKVSLWQAWQQPVMVTAAAETKTDAAAAPVAEGSEAAAAAAAVAAPVTTLHYESRKRLVATALLPSAQLLDARSPPAGARAGPRAACQLALLPEPPLFDGGGIRLSLEEGLQKAAQQAVGGARFALELHHGCCWASVMSAGCGGSGA
jgi:hypothetical protein